MAPLTQAEVNSLMKELQPLNTDAEMRTKLGVKVYEALFEAKPESIKMFSKIGGLDKNTLKGSEGLRYYGRTYVEEVLRFVHAGSNDDELKKLVEMSIEDQKRRNVSKDQFMSGESIFSGVFDSILKEENNKQLMEKLFKYLVTAIGDHL